MIGILKIISGGRPPVFKEKGFTLIEVVVAVVILGFAYLAVLQNFSVSLKNIARLERNGTEVFEKALAFDAELRPAGEEDTEDRPATESEGAVFDTSETYLEGSKYRLVLVSGNGFMTLMLERI